MQATLATHHPKPSADRRLWTIQPHNDVRTLLDRLAKRHAKSGFNRNHNLNRALRVGLQAVLKEEGVAP